MNNAKYIVVTGASKDTYWYADKIGEILKVTGDFDREGYLVEYDGTTDVYLVDYADCKEVDSILDIIANLSRRVSVLERAAKRLNIEKATEEIDRAVIKKRQPTRDEIVRRAIEDVAELTSESSYGKFEVRNVVDGCLEPFDPDYDEVIFEVNRDKRTVIALIRYEEEKTVWARGIAKCAPNDVFNAHIGKAIALRRALGLEVPAEYMDAPQPKEPRVGDVVQAYGYGGNPLPLVVVDAIEKHSGEIRIKRDKHKENYIPFEPECGDYIFDDTGSTERAAQEATANDR